MGRRAAKLIALSLLPTLAFVAPSAAQQVKWRVISVSLESPVFAPVFPQAAGYRYFDRFNYAATTTQSKLVTPFSASHVMVAKAPALQAASVTAEPTIGVVATGSVLAAR